MESEKDFLEALSLLFPSTNCASECAMNIFRSQFIISPKSILSNFNTVNLVIVSLCSGKNPRWGEVSCMVELISKALMMYSEFFPIIAADLIDLSRIITQSCNASSTSEYPNIISLADAIKQSYKSGPSLTLESILALVRHCISGFLPHCSLVSVMSDHFDSVVSILLSIETSYYPLLASAISSPDRDASLFFIVCWSVLMKSFLCHPYAISCLAGQATVLTHFTKGPSAFCIPSRFLLDCIRSTPAKRDSLLKIISSSEKQMVQCLQKAVEVPIWIEKIRSSSKISYAVHRADVNVLEASGILKKKKWVNYNFILMEEVSAIMWSTDPQMLKEGEALHLSEVTSLFVLPPNEVESGMKNILKVSTEKEEYLISFKSYDEAIQWQNILRQQLTNLKS